MPDVSRRTFFKNSTLFLGGLATQHWLRKTGITVSAQTTSSRPFRMLTLGDSVMWGQGLLEKDKFSHQVKKWLEQDKGIAGVDLKVMAHSGATITVGSNLDNDPTFRCMDGEINRSNPTIIKQVRFAAEDYCRQNIPLEDVDLILLNGGINDVDKLTIFGGLELKKVKVLRVRTSVAQIQTLASTYCDMEMRKLLSYVAATFPNARIVLTGYFPIITCATPRWALAHLILQALGLMKLPSEKLVELMQTGITESDEEPANFCQDHDLGPLHRRLSVLSEAWRRESDAALCRAAKWINETTPWVTRVNPTAPCVLPGKPPEAVGKKTLELCSDPLLTGMPVSQNRVFFARPEFKEENGYGAANSFLWQLVPNPTNDPIPCVTGVLKHVQGLVVNEDVLQDKRPCWCCEAGGKFKNNLACIRAGAFHPNDKGALAYRDAVVKELEKVYADTGWAGVNWGTALPSSSDHRTPGTACTAISCPN